MEVEDEILGRIWGDLGGRVGGPMTFRLLEVLLVAFLLACVPYLLIRGLVNRLAGAGRQHRQA